MASVNNAPPLTLDALATGEKYKPRPGIRYALKPGDGPNSPPALVGTLRAPTDTLVAEFDALAQNGTRGSKRLERLARRRVMCDRLARGLAAGTLTPADVAELDGRTLDTLDAEADQIEDDMRSADPTNPASEFYYVRVILAKADVALDVADADGNAVRLSDVDGIELRVADTAVADFLTLAFSPTGSRG